jgi:hypothetical protein
MLRLSIRFQFQVRVWVEHIQQFHEVHGDGLGSVLVGNLLKMIVDQRPQERAVSLDFGRARRESSIMDRHAF